MQGTVTEQFSRNRMSPGTGRSTELLCRDGKVKVPTIRLSDRLLLRWEHLGQDGLPVHVRWHSLVGRTATRRPVRASRRNAWWTALLLFFLALVGCRGGEGASLRCVDVEAPTATWFLLRIDGEATSARIESSLGGYVGDRGTVEATDATYRIGVPLPNDSLDRRNEFRIDRITGSGRMFTVDRSGDVANGTVSLDLECERIQPDERL